MMHFFAKKTACLAIVTGTRFVQLFPKGLAIFLR
jgi:hypothetical protein